MSTLSNSFKLLYRPLRAWQDIAGKSSGSLHTLLTHTLPFALIPALCWYYGISQVGWNVAGETVKLTPESALPMCVLFYLAMIAGVIFLGFMVQWMRDTFASASSLAEAIKLISYTATPFFLAGILGLYPMLWIDILIGSLVALYCIYLLYIGTGPVMGVPAERSFLYASAVFAVALVAFVALLGATAVVWDFGLQPEYTY